MEPCIIVQAQVVVFVEVEHAATYVQRVVNVPFGRKTTLEMLKILMIEISVAVVVALVIVGNQEPAVLWPITPFLRAADDPAVVVDRFRAGASTASMGPFICRYKMWYK